MSRTASAAAAVPAFPRVLDAASEESRAKEIAQRLGIPYVDLWTFRVDPALFKSVPLEWMLRFEFVPESEEDGDLAVVMTDPTDVVQARRARGPHEAPPAGEGRLAGRDAGDPAEVRVDPAGPRGGDRGVPDARS